MKNPTVPRWEDSGIPLYFGAYTMCFIACGLWGNFTENLQDIEVLCPFSASIQEAFKIQS